MKFSKFSIQTSKVSGIKVILPIPVYHKMLAYAQASKGEISGFGRTRTENKHGKTIVTITDVRIFTQTVTSGGTTLDRKALSKFIVELVNSGEKPQRWNLWWHSHNDFHVFFSGIDTDTIELLSKNSRLYSICINKKGDLVGRVDEPHNELGSAEVIVDKYINQKILASCREEVKEKVTFKEVSIITSGMDSYPFQRTIEESFYGD